jgi:hypothetical protein
MKAAPILGLVLVATIVHPAWAENSNGCFNFGEPWPWKFDHGKLTMQKLTPAEIQEGLNKLRSVNDNKNDPSLKGALVFDGTVTQSLPKDKSGQPAWVVHPTRIHLGAERLRHTTVKVKSPTAENNGIRLIVGHSYRLFAVDPQKLLGKGVGDLYTWGAAVDLK